jgi:hypothetical protein
MTAGAMTGGTAQALPADSHRVPLIRTWRLVAFVASLLFAIVWTVAQGKDVHWDAVNYHLYLGYSALNDRFALDFFAAGPPSYLNPYAFAPLYLMSAAGWSAIAIAVTLAAWHALALWLTYEIALVASALQHRGASPPFALLAVVFAASNPVLLQALGATMSDLSTAVPVLAGWLCLSRAVRDGGLSKVAIAGLLCGVATALKLSNAVFAMAAVPALVFLPGPLASRVRAIALFCLVCAVAFALVSLPWSWQLWREFGNPLFPFLNEHFRSPDFIVERLRYERFIPPSWVAFVTRPFEMVSAASTVHTEPRAPDVRYAVLILALVVWAGVTRMRRGTAARDASGRATVAGDRVLASLVVGLAVAWCIWLAISGNSRYFLPMACIAGAVLALVLQRLHAIWPSTTVAAVLVVASVQAVQFGFGTDWNRDGGPWQGPWLRVEVPERLQREPNLYLSAGFLSGSAFMPYVHPRSGMINIGGFHILAPGHPGGTRAQAYIDRNQDRLRLLLPLPPGVVDRASLPGPPESLAVYVRRLGLRVDGSDCEFLRLEGNLRGERRPASSGNLWKHFIACALRPAPDERARYERDIRDIDVVFDRVEDACPNLFHPRRPATQEYRFLARTYHMGSEMQLFAEEGRIKYFFPLRGGDPIDIGSVEAWKQGPQAFDCSRRTSPAFMNVRR